MSRKPKLPVVPVPDVHTYEPKEIPIPKTVWFEESSGFMHELSSDIPTRYTRQSGLHEKVPGMFPLHQACTYDDIEVYMQHWTLGMRVEAPREVTLEVHVLVKSHLTTAQVVKALQGKLGGRQDEEARHSILSTQVLSAKEPA